MKFLKRLRKRRAIPALSPKRLDLSLECLESRLLLSTQYTLTDLGNLGGNSCAAAGINDSGQVTGYAWTASQQNRAFRWQNGVITKLPTDAAWIGGTYSYGNDVNNSGRVALTVEFSGGLERAAYYDGTNIQNIHTVSSGYESQAYAINDAGKVAGSYGQDATQRAFLWSSATGMTALDTVKSLAYDLNASDRVVGRYLSNTGYNHACYWENGSRADIHGSSTFASEAWGVNSSGQVVGWRNSGSDKHAFLWDSVNGMRDLGTLDENDDYDSYAWDINASGQVVGESLVWVNGSSIEKRAFIYENGAMTKLDDLVDNDTGWAIQVATHINASGQIVGYGMLNGAYHGFLLTPVDSQAPTASVTASNVTATGANTYTFTVNYADNVAIKATTIDNSDIRVTGPNGFNVGAVYAGIDVTGNGTPKVVTYRITPPGGTWNDTDNGTFTISMVANQVSDTNNNYIPAATLGTFSVAISPPVNPSLQGAYITTQTPTSAGTTGFDHIDMTFNEAIKADTFTAADVVLKSPANQPITVTQVSLVSGLTWRISFANQTVGGDYTLQVGPDIHDQDDNHMDLDRDGTSGETIGLQDVYQGTVRINPNAFMITGQSPTGDAEGKLSEIAFTFSDTVKATSFAKADDVMLTGPDGNIAINNLTLVSGNTWKVTFADQIKAGTYTLKVGPNVTNNLDIKMDQDGDGTPGETSQDVYTGTINLAASDLKVSSHSPTSRQTSGCDHADIIFTEAIDAATFTATDVTLTGPAGAITISGIEKVSNTKYQIKFPQQTAYGDYTIKIGPTIATADGKLLNQDGDAIPGENPGDIYTGVIPIGSQPVQTGFVVQSIVSPTLTIAAGAQTGHDALGMSYLNYGPNESNATIALYLSPDAQVDTNDTRYFVSQTNQQIPVGAVRGTSYDLKVPSSPGKYYLKYQVGENWSPTITLIVKPADSKPLIAINHLNASKTDVKAGEPFTFTMDITNQGPVDYVMDAIRDQHPGDGKEAVILCWNNVVGWGINGSFEVPYIAAGGTTTVTYIASGRNPSFGDSVKYYVKFTSNWFSNVQNPYSDFTSEFKQITSSKPTWPSDAKPDLTCNLNATVPAEVTPGSEIPFTLDVTNISNKVIYSGTEVGLLRSTNDTFDKNDAFMMNYQTTPMLPHASTSFQGKIVAPSTPGTYYYACLADSYLYDYYAGGKIDESNENNNWSNILTVKVGNAQATADVTWPPIGENLDASVLNDAAKRYIEINYAHADTKTINGDEISLAGKGAEKVKLGAMTKVDDDTFRYALTGSFQAGPVDINIKAGTFKNNSAEANAADKESFGVLPDISPFVLTYDTQQSVWDPATQKFGYHGQAQLGMKRTGGGVDPLVTISGDLLYNDLKIGLQNVTVTADIGGFNVPLVEGSFEIDVKTKVADMADKLPSEYRFAGCILAIDNIAFATPQGQPSQLEIQGSLKFKPNLNELEVSVADPNKIIISPTGIHLTGGEIKIPDIDNETFGLNALKFKMEGLSMEYVAAKKPPEVTQETPDKFILHGKISLPGFYNLTVDLAKNELEPDKSNYIEYTDKDGPVLVGKLSAEKMALVPGVWELKSIELAVDGKTGLIQGDAAIKIPITSRTIVCGLGLLNGGLNYAALGVDDLNIPFGTSPIFLQKIVGTVNNMAPDATDPLAFGGKLGLTLGPQITLDWFDPIIALLGEDAIEKPDEDPALMRLDLEAELNRDKITGNGKLTLIHEKILEGEVVGSIDYTNYFVQDHDTNATPGKYGIITKASGQISALFGLYEGEGSFTMDTHKQTTLNLSGKGTYKVPEFVPIWGGTKLTESNILANYSDDQNDANDFVATWGTLYITKFGLGYTLVSGNKFNFDGTTQYLGAKEVKDLTPSLKAAQSLNCYSIAAAHEDPQNLQPASLMGFQALGTSAAKGYQIPTNTAWTLMGVEWDNDLADARISLTGPDGTHYDEAAINDPLSSMVIVPDLSSLQRKVVMVMNPAAGSWEVRVTSSQGSLQNPTYGAYVNAPAPEVSITHVAKQGRRVAIDYTATDGDGDSHVSLYCDTNNTGTDGILIAEGLAANGPGSFVWELPRDLAVGSYYIYALAHDDYNAPVTAYATVPFEVETLPPQTKVSFNSKGLINYTDADGSLVTVKIAAGEAKAYFSGSVGAVDTKTGELSGSNLKLESLVLITGTDKTAITITASGGTDGIMELGSITGSSLGKLTAKNTRLLGDIELAGSLGAMTVGDIADSVDIVTGQTGKGLALTAGMIGNNVDIAIADKVTKVAVTRFASGSLTAKDIGSITAKQGPFGADLTALTGGIGKISVVGNITGDFSAAMNITSITTKGGGITGTLRARNDIGTITADSMTGAILSAGRNIKTVSVKGDMLDSFLLAGYDIGADMAFGGGDISGSGDIGSVSVSKSFARSFVAAAVVPHSPLTNMLPDVGLPGLGVKGTIGTVKFGTINPTADYEFGLYAATSIKTKLTSNGTFIVKP